MLNINLKRQCYTYKHNAATDNIYSFMSTCTNIYFMYLKPIYITCLGDLDIPSPLGHM